MTIGPGRFQGHGGGLYVFGRCQRRVAINNFPLFDRERNQGTSVNKGPELRPLRVYSVFTLGKDAKTGVWPSEGAQRATLSLVPALLDSDEHHLSTQDVHRKGT